MLSALTVLFAWSAQVKIVDVEKLKAGELDFNPERVTPAPRPRSRHLNHNPSEGSHIGVHQVISEIQILKALKHPNIVRLIDAAEAPAPASSG